MATAYRRVEEETQDLGIGTEKVNLREIEFVSKDTMEQGITYIYVMALLGNNNTGSIHSNTRQVFYRSATSGSGHVCVEEQARGTGRKQAREETAGKNV